MLGLTLLKQESTTQFQDLGGGAGDALIPGGPVSRRAGDARMFHREFRPLRTGALRVTMCAVRFRGPPTLLWLRRLARTFLRSRTNHISLRGLTPLPAS